MFFLETQVKVLLPTIHRDVNAVHIETSNMISLENDAPYIANRTRMKLSEFQLFYINNYVLFAPYCPTYVLKVGDVLYSNVVSEPIYSIA